MSQKYLFFDMEYATSKGSVRGCEFGYVLTDEKFRVLAKENIIINPNILRSEWDYYVVNHILTRSIAEYESRPKFPYFYEKIRNLILMSDRVFGHTLSSDAEALNDDCKRYELPSIDFDFYDVKEFYRAYASSHNGLGVSAILEAMHIVGQGKEHDAGVDALNTMLVLKAILDSLEVSLEDLLILCPTSQDRSEGYLVASLEATRQLQEEREPRTPKRPKADANDILYHRFNGRRFSQFIDNAKPQGEVGVRFQGQKVCLSSGYENHHFRQCMNLAQLITNEGGQITRKASLSNVFVKYDVYNEDGTLVTDIRYEYVALENEYGGHIEIIEFEELLSRLGITEQELDEMPPISLDFVYEDGAIIRDKRDFERIQARKRRQNAATGAPIYSTEEVHGTLGDLFRELLLSFTTQ